MTRVDKFSAKLYVAILDVKHDWLSTNERLVDELKPLR